MFPQGVFVGITSTEFSFIPRPASIAGIGGVGHCFAAGRLSYILGLHGPAVAMDTACSASLVACHSARRALQSDECQTAVLAGVSAMLLPLVSVSYAAGGLTSSRGRCHTFDARADGFGRGEACGAAILGADGVGDQVHILATAVRQDGKSASLTSPNGKAQQFLLLATYSDGSILSLACLETHGTGTALGDPIEMGAFAAVVASPPVQPVQVGGAKANVGHTEPAAGMVGILKLALGVQGTQVAPNAQLRVLNPHVLARIDERPCGLPTQLGRQLDLDGYRLGGVSSFGLGGTIAHAVSKSGDRATSPVKCKVDTFVFKRRNFSWRQASLVAEQTRGEVYTHSVSFTAHSQGKALGSPRWSERALLLRIGRSQPPANTNKGTAWVTHGVDADIVIIGGGITGITVARDAAACGYSSLIIEQEPHIGGVWVKNDYPGLRLHNLGASYRCLSLAPPWQRDNDIYYRPTQPEILSYVRQMASHELIRVRTSTSYTSHVDDVSEGLKRVTCDAGVFRCRALLFATGTYETTSGAPHMPIDPAGVTNGATIVHSSNLASHKGAFERARKKYIVGASKAAIDVLRNLDPDDESIVWVHRGHVLFLNRDAMMPKDPATHVPEPNTQERINASRVASSALKDQIFGPYEQMLVSSGQAHRVGAPHASQPQQRGGIEDEATIAHCRRFLPRQRMLSRVYCEGGSLVIACEDESLIVGPEDVVCLCTGQRAGHGSSWYERCAEMNKNGVFTVVPYSGSGPACAQYTTHFIISYLDGRPTIYSTGELSAKLSKIAVHQKAVPNQGAWPLFMSFLGAIQTDIIEAVFPADNFGSWDLTSSYLWYGKWFEEDCDVRRCLAELSTPPSSLAGASGSLVLQVSETVVLLFVGAETGAPDVHASQATLQVAQQVALLQVSPRVLLLTCGSLLPIPSAAPSPSACAAHGGIDGLARVVRLEVVQLQLVSADLGRAYDGAAVLALIAKLATLVATEVELAIFNRVALVPRMRSRSVLVPLAATPAVPLGSRQKTLGVTGGLGGLGLRAAAALRDYGSVHLFSRSGRVAHTAQEMTDAGIPRSANVFVVAVDISETAEAVRAVWCLSDGGRLSVVHTAGIARDGIIHNMTAERFASVHAPKSRGAWSLNVLTQQLDLEACMLFSSLTSALGNVGQANYAAANAQMDSFARHRRASAGVATSLQLPLVTGAGMGEAMVHGLDLHGQYDALSLSLQEYADCLRALCHSAGDGNANTTQALLRSSAILDIPLRRKEWASSACEAGSRLSEYRSSSSPTCMQLAPTNEFQQQLVHVPLADRRGHVARHVLAVVREFIPDDGTRLSTDVSLMEQGLDSLAATQLSTKLSELTGVQLSTTLSFEQPTSRAISDHILALAEQQKSTGSVEAPVSPHRAAGQAKEVRVHLKGIASRLPGGVSAAGSLHTMQCAAGDAITPVVANRWAHEQQLDFAAVYGGFLAAVECFDLSLFRLSESETFAMDPQQRLLLEAGYAALHSSGQRLASLLGTDSGVFVGIEHLDWQLLHALKTSKTALMRGSPYAAPGEQAHAASARLAYVLDIRGPSMSINTACSSGLVALHLSTSAIRSGECHSALSASVKLILQPYLVGGGIMAPDGRSKTFDARADGYGRSEAIGAMRLDVDQEALTSVAGSAVLSGGRGASLTAPNGTAQRSAIERALINAVFSAKDVGCVQAQGLGSALADPIETRAVVAAVGSGRTSSLSVGSHKASAGHSEAPSGLLALLVAQGAIQQECVAANAQLRSLNAHILASLQTSSSVTLPTNAQAFGAACAHGVAAFGVSGIVAHAILQAGRAPGRLMSLHRPISLEFARSSFPWRNPMHPFVQYQLSAADGSASFRSPVSGALHMIVADHIVQSRVIFPGAGYLELARAAWSVLNSLAGGACALRAIFFLMPLVVEADDTLVECATNSSQFEVRSGEPQGQSLVGVTAHCSGTMGGDMQGGTQEADHSAARAVCGVHTMHAPGFYIASHAAGMWYGPDYRSLVQAWDGYDGDAALSRLRDRVHWQGTQVHPGDVDGALQLGSVISMGKGSSDDTWLPFAIDSALLRTADCGLWTVRGLPATCTAVGPCTASCMHSCRTHSSPHATCYDRRL